MTQSNEGESSPKIIIDSDWKKDAAAEKERLEEELRDVGADEPLPDPSLLEIVNMIVMQASMGLGGYKTPAGEVIPPDIALAKHYIDLLDLLNTRTAGNTTAEERRVIDSVLHEMRMHYVHVTTQPKAAIPKPGAPGAGRM